MSTDTAELCVDSSPREHSRGPAAVATAFPAATAAAVEVLRAGGDAADAAAGGATLLQALRILEVLTPSPGDRGTAADVACTADAIYAAFAFPERWPLAPGEFTPSLRDWMLGDRLASEQA